MNDLAIGLIFWGAMLGLPILIVGIKIWLDMRS